MWLKCFEKSIYPVSYKTIRVNQNGQCQLVFLYRVLTKGIVCHKEKDRVAAGKELFNFQGHAIVLWLWFYYVKIHLSGSRTSVW